MKPVRVLHVGTSSRAHILAEAMLRSAHPVENYMLCDVRNPGLESVATDLVVGACDDPEVVAKYAGEIAPDFCIPGPEGPLAAGVVDRLAAMGIPSVGPVKALAQLEASKSFTRALLSEFEIPGNPRYRVFESDEGLPEFLRELGEFVVKPDGLTGGKGVRVSGDHLQSIDEGAAYARELIAAGGKVVIEEKLIGEEFSLQSFCDGQATADMIPAQDHKRLSEGDTGPNTGGMGSYSCADHLLPFLKPADIKAASEINQRVAEALMRKTGTPYKGILYGNFMLTAGGLRVIEYNARFGDPEVMNVLSVLESDLVDICRAIIAGRLAEAPVTFARRASVCKYVVPRGYPDHPQKDVAIGMPPTGDNRGDLRLYWGGVRQGAGGEIVLTGSRAIACVGIGETLADAERLAETGAQNIKGPVVHRRDIGTEALIGRRVEHMRGLRGGNAGAVRHYA